MLEISQPLKTKRSLEWTSMSAQEHQNFLQNELSHELQHCSHVLSKKIPKVCTTLRRF